MSRILRAVDAGDAALRVIRVRFRSFLFGNDKYAHAGCSAIVSAKNDPAEPEPRTRTSVSVCKKVISDDENTE